MMKSNFASTDRSSGIELLRIIGIFMVVSIHATGLISGWKFNDIGITTNKIINCFGNLGVSFFIIISGYFGVTRNWRKMASMEFMVIFYSVCMAVLTRLIWPEDYPRSLILELLEKSVMPVVTRKHWYYSCYMCLLIFAPAINFIAIKLSKKDFSRLLLLGFLIFSIAPTFLRYEIMLDGGKGLVNMILLYYIGRYIGLYEDWKMKRSVAVGGLILLALIVYFGSSIPVRTNLVALDLFHDYSSTMIGMAVLALYLVKNMTFVSPVINWISKHVFAIYILNVPVMKILDKYIFKLDAEKIAGSRMPLWILGLIVMTILVCFLIEMLRRIFLLKLMDNISAWCVDKALQFASQFTKKERIRQIIHRIQDTHVS